MAKAKKFGAFAGVFTPSILTILGVIMYMRLGWVVGQAGIINALGIIVISHIISVSTGLSISSIATDKKIKTGGIYYMLSRSLGLPMGGAIGIALFIGTALGISLYIVGFSESLLGLEAVRNFLGIENNINGYRILGTGVIIILVILAFISTSLAIKTQFFILTAIALSLVSVWVGFFVNPAFTPEQVIMQPADNNITLEYVFSIFFPAVTGFTAGVAMSGDLKDPKKDIPRGTMASIIVGFVVYVALAIGLAIFIDRDILINDKNFLEKIAWFSPFVLAGIWGATLSSALGGILGGPRILQAIALDRILPRFLGKGYGPSKEPRTALIFIFIIAEMGILIGELNVIASVVSMFYLASYGFINLAYALEGWASTDFRPSFKIPLIIGIIGFLACFGVMFKLDMVSMFIALIIMGGIYFLLKKRELQLEFGDVWQSVWTTIVRSALHRIDKKDIEDRNWQPNIILFSGGTKRRPHLLEFGKALVGKFGLLSNFDLHEDKNAKILFPKHKQSVQSEESRFSSIFSRQQTCRDVYQGIETISATYGFAGVEPNTVLLGWGRSTESPARFLEMLNTIYDLDLNVLMLDYDKKAGFGEKKQIDIWWRGAGNNGNLSITLSKFLLASPDWGGAHVRLLVVNPVNDEADKIRKNAFKVLEILRIRATVKIINNQVEKKKFYDIIRVESVNTDLIFLGFPSKIDPGIAESFVKKTNELMRDIGTVVLVRASSMFKNLKFGTSIELTKTKKRQKDIQLVAPAELTIPEISFPEHTASSEQLTALYKEIKQINYDIQQNFILNLTKYHHNLIFSFEKQIKNSFDEIEEVHQNTYLPNQQKKLIKINNKFLKNTRKIINDFQEEVVETQKNILSRSSEYYILEQNSILQSAPEKISLQYKADEIKPTKNDSLRVKLIKLNKQFVAAFQLPKNKYQYNLNYRLLLNCHLPQKAYQNYYDFLEKWGLVSLQFVVEIQKLLIFARNSMFHLETANDEFRLTIKEIKKQRLKISNELKNLKNITAQSVNSLFGLLMYKNATTVQQISNHAKKIHANNLSRRNSANKRLTQHLNQEIKRIPDLWQRNQHLLYNSTILELHLFSFENKLRKIFNETSHQIEITVEDIVINHLLELDKLIKNYLQKLTENQKIDFDANRLRVKPETVVNQSYVKAIVDTTFKNIKQAISKFPDKVEILSEESMNNFSRVQFKEIKAVPVSAKRLLDYIVQDELIDSLQKMADELPVRLETLNAATKDIVRLISFSLHPSQEDNLIHIGNNDEDVIAFLQEQHKKITEHIEIARKYQKISLLKIQERLNATSNKLSFYSFTHLARNLKQYMKEQDAKRKSPFFRKTSQKISGFFSHQLELFWYRQSKTMLLARRINPFDSKEHTGVDDLLNLLEQVSINQKVLRKLPFYYKQLFLRKHNYYNEFWFNREEELKQAQRTIRRYKQGHKGAILIYGEQNSGKTFCSQYISTHSIEHANIYIVNPEFQGSISQRRFKQKFEQAVNIKDSYNQIFKQLPENPVIIIEDLELWWEKSEAGFNVINLITELIDTYSSKCLFIVNVNTHSFRLMNKIKRIDKYFLNLIECKPLDAETLKKLILFRHQSSSLLLNYKGKTQHQLKNYHYAGLFAKYFNFSRGNVGVALHSWIANIYDYTDNTIYIQVPQTPDLSQLDNLEIEYFELITLLILHKRLSIERLKRITFQNSSQIRKKINFLQRSGVVIENNEGVFELNPLLYIHLKYKLEEKEML